LFTFPVADFYFARRRIFWHFFLCIFINRGLINLFDLFLFLPTQNISFIFLHFADRDCDPYKIYVKKYCISSSLNFVLHCFSFLLYHCFGNLFVSFVSGRKSKFALLCVKLLFFCTVKFFFVSVFIFVHALPNFASFKAFSLALFTIFGLATLNICQKIWAFGNLWSHTWLKSWGLWNCCPRS